MRIKAYRRLLDTVFTVEAIDAAGRINQALLAGVVRMAVRAYFDLNFAQGRASLKGVAAGAGNDAAAVVGMDFCFHFNRTGSNRRHW